MNKLTKEQMSKLPEFAGATAVRSNIVQNLKVLSARGNRIKVVAAVPGSVGFTPDGMIKVEYTALSHMTHEVVDDPIVDLNHHEDERIGTIVGTEHDTEGNLLVEFEISPKFSFFTEIVRSNLHDGVSIESTITSGRWLTDRHLAVLSYKLTGIAVLFAKPPACDKEICRVLSHDAAAKQHLDIHELIARIDGMQEADLKATFKNIEHEIEERGLKPTV